MHGYESHWSTEYGFELRVDQTENGTRYRQNRNYEMARLDLELSTKGQRHRNRFHSTGSRYVKPTKLLAQDNSTKLFGHQL